MAYYAPAALPRLPPPEMSPEMSPEMGPDEAHLAARPQFRVSAAD